MFWCISVLFLISISISYERYKLYLTTRVLNLNGDSWRVTNVNGSISVPATVPGQVHMDLYRNKIIPNPYFDDNVLS